jgi:folate-binding Fe-S cluster repair protein YgfZ
MLSRINRQLRPVLFSFYQSQSQLLNQYSSSTLSSSSSSSSEQCTAYDLTRYRSLIRIKGQDSAKYLQSLITNNIYNLNNEHVIYSMILNNRGRCMYDVLVYANEGINQQEFLIEFDSDYTNELMKFLNVYRIRKKVEISHVDNELKLYALVNFYRTNPVKADPNHLFLCSPDPRSINLGHRVVISSPNESVSIKNYFNAQISTDITEYKKNLYKNGVAENQLDIPSNKSIPLEYNIALMNGVSFSKGYYYIIIDLKIKKKINKA